MSRVFEALAKATEQKQTQANGSQGELGNSSARFGSSMRVSPYTRHTR